jgi:23S rRNA (cytidine1920-2'-O)/16S rRNA (cytidine1409-2'-O)-methyltransferase
MRLDQVLVQLRIAPSRTKAQDLIREGVVEIFDGREWKTAESVSEDVAKWNLPEEPSRVRLRESQALKYVSRGGLKLEAALRHLGLSVKNWTCLDVGQSTGGFTDCLLQAGAAKVVGFDVGHGQLSGPLRRDARVVGLEGLHFKEAAQNERLLQERPAAGFDLIVADLSFVSIEKVFPIFGIFGARLLTLVKPQFEVGAENLNRKGVVADAALYERVENQVREAARLNGWKTLAYFASEVEGRDGNREFFLYAERSGSDE